VAQSCVEAEEVAVDTRAEIRAAALELFAAKGYEQSSLREIAEKVGLTKASLYYHYPSKQALLRAIVEPLTAEWARVVDDAERLPPTAANVRAVLSDCLDAMLDHRGAAAMFARDAVAVFAEIEPLWRDLLALSVRLQSWLAGPDPSTADRIRAMASAEVLGACLSSSLFAPEASDEEVRGVLLDAALAVLGVGAQA
jgi:AcrR family transcriptional regulator